jgi:hypothetical protein
MFDRELCFGEHEIAIKLQSRTYLEHNDCYFFGFPLYPNLSEVTNSTIRETVNSIKGHFLYVGIEQDRLVIANDIAGGYRLYTTCIDNVTYYSDDYEYLLGVMRERGDLQLNDNEYRYWTKRNYTTGGATFVIGLVKLEPASIVEVSVEGIRRECYFQDIANTPDFAKHTEKCISDLTETMGYVASLDNEIILNFSGGVDSSLLALLLKELKRDFVLLFAKSRPPYMENYGDYVKAKAVARYLGIPLREIEVDVDCALDKLATIVKAMIFDRHVAAYQYFGSMEQMRKEFGPDTIAINGQGADSILTFGPSRRRRADYIARLLSNRPSGVPSRLAGELVRLTRGRNCRIPKNLPEFLSAFFDSFGYYYPLLSGLDSEDYLRYKEALVTRKTVCFEHLDSKVMYLEIYGLLQGTDSRVMLKSAQVAGFDNIVMPYKSPAIIYATVRHKDKTRDIYSPKYVIHRALKRLGASLPAVSVKCDESIPSQHRLTQRIKELYFSESKRIFASNRI